MIHLLVILLLTIGQPKNVESACDGNCKTKTYRLSSELNPNCTNNCPYESTIRVFGNDFNERLNLTVVGRNVEETEALTLSLQFIIGSTKNYYICFKFTSNQTAAVISRFGLIRPLGLSFYSKMDKSIHCSWNMTRNQRDNWPLAGAEAAELTKNLNYNITFSHNSTDVVVDVNPRGLPIYARQYLTCCGYSLLGDNKYSLAAKANHNSTDFLFQFLEGGPKPYKIELNLNDNINITTVCNFNTSSITGFLTLKGKANSIGQYGWFHGRITHNYCRWVIPKTVNYYSGKVDVSTKSFGFKIIADNAVVYSKVDVNGTSYLSYASNPSSSFLIIMSLIMMSYLLI
uniref:Uncharacterized protein n=1 Tax=Tetranychus urticae TaxID=32264 RepID=T1KF78_TETUR